MHANKSFRSTPLFGLVLLVFVFLSCATGPSGPAEGTPGWYWQNALTTWEAGDYQKTSDNLEELIEPGSEFADRAQPWRLILTAGMAKGYMDVAEAFENGARANQAASSEFRMHRNNYRTLVNRQVAAFWETLVAYKKSNPAGEIPLAFSYPQGSAVPVAALARVGEGIKLSEAELPSVERQAIQRAVLMTTCRFAGAEEDTAKTQQIFSAGEVKVPKETFDFALAKTLNEIAWFYSAYEMDQPDRLKMLNEQALEIAKGLPENDDTKELIRQIESHIKEAEKRL